VFLSGLLVFVRYDWCVKLSDYARKMGVNYHTAYDWWRKGLLPVPAEQLPSGTIIVHAETVADGETVVYARVSSADQSSGLDAQVARCVGWATSSGLQVDRVVTEVGSALNGARRKFVRLLSDSNVAVIVCEHRDRVCRFGFEYVQAALGGSGRRIEVVDDGELEDDLVRDLTEVVTSLCARVYGRRGAKRRAEAALASAQSVDVGGAG